MKKIFIPLLAAALAACTFAGSHMSDLDKAYEAYDYGRYSDAQSICDSIVKNNGLESLDVSGLCRLSMLLMHLGENSGNEDINTATAARCLSTAFSRDSDSTKTVILAMPSEDRARTMILTALDEASRRNINSDSIVIPTDTIPTDEI